MPTEKDTIETKVHYDNDLQSRLSFFQFSHKDEEHLKSLSKVFAPHISDIVNRFYAHLQGFEETASLLTDESIATRLRETQRRFLERLTEGNYDQQNAVERSQIGHIYNRVGFAPKWYLGAYNLYFQLLIPLICQAYRDEPEYIQDAILALNKVLMLDMQSAVDTYIEHQQIKTQIVQSEKFSAIGQLVAQVAHEIRNPLSSMELNLDLLADEIGDGANIDVGEAQELLQSVHNEVERLADIVSDYLSFARLPKFEFELEALNGVIRTFCNFVEPQLEQSNITCSTDLAENLPLTLLDDEQILRALHNFLKNAIEAMPSGGEFVIQTHLESSQIVMRISDTGMGIPLSNQKRIFDPFFTTKKEGTGLGLPLACEIIKHHQGTTFCESVVDQGTRFTITFPIRGEPVSEI
ncbi:MAG: protoglobin domain-containing protein [Candidatus Poribacteria bacterium]|nr:protoglobin domain-containing protein [Candidatus Poribacteria bacterium]